MERRMSDVRQQLLALGKDESLWTGHFAAALSRLLEVAERGIGADVVSIWQFTDRGQQLVCLARRERHKGPEPSGDVLAADACPAYFEALANERVLAAANAITDPRTAELRDSYLIPAGFSALLDATIRRAGRVAGVLCCEHREVQTGWDEAQTELAVGLADLAAQLMVLTELRRRDQLQGLLLSMAPELRQNHTPQEFAALAVAKLAHVFPGAWTAFYQTGPDEDHAELLALYAPGAPPGFKEKLHRLPLDNTVVGLALRECRMVAVGGTSAQHMHLWHESRSAGLKTLLGIPLIHEQSLVGVMVMALRLHYVFTDDDLASFELASSPLAVAMANARNVEALRHRALHDALTGLPNRDKLQQDIEHLCAPTAEVQALTLLLLDVRDFRQINDTLGRGSGDQLLQAVAGRLQSGPAAAGGQAYRLTSSEFALLLPQRVPAAELQERALALQALLAQPFTVSGLTLILRLRIGTATMASDDCGGHELLRAADVALGWADAEPSGVCAYDRVRDNSGPRRLEMISELRRALGTEQLSLHFQPKVRVADGRLAGCEALLRWEHPRYGRVPPSVFIGVAEKGELMSLLTHEVLKQALAQSHAMRAAGLFTSVAVNVSGHNMVDAAFPETVRTLLAQSGLPPEALTLEITETVLMSDPERAAAVIGDLARQGLALDIDDFGTGYSSLAYLRRLPLRSLKIDRAFVRELTANAQDVHIVRSTVGLAHGLGLSVIAEGVEDSSTLELLGTLGCDMAQGFGICRPVPLPELLAWARARGELQASAAPA
jgi:diguanylate cyclase (GGDEF)-like protein